MNQPLIQPTDVYTVFAGNIDQDAVQRLTRGVALATQNNVKNFHILLQSTGGFIADGICLYNFFHSSPIDITLYNAGSVQSVAAIAYLGAKRRKTSSHATFMLHRSYASPQGATSDKLQSMVHGLIIDDERVESILREHVKIPKEKWEIHKNADIWFTAKEAVECGLANEIGEFAPPIGTQIFSL